MDETFSKKLKNKNKREKRWVGKERTGSGLATSGRARSFCAALVTLTTSPSRGLGMAGDNGRLSLPCRGARRVAWRRGRKTRRNSHPGFRWGSELGPVGRQLERRGGPGILLAVPGTFYGTLRASKGCAVLPGFRPGAAPCTRPQATPLLLPSVPL